MANYAVRIYQQTRLSSKQYTIAIITRTSIRSRVSHLQTLDVDKRIYTAQYETGMLMIM